MLQKVDLASLRIAHAEPIWVGEPLAVVAITSVRVAKLGRFLGIREGFFVDLVELCHELSAVDLDARTHCHSIDGEQVLKGESKHKDQHVEEFFRHLILAGRYSTHLQVVLLEKTRRHVSSC